MVRVFLTPSFVAGFGPDIPAAYPSAICRHHSLGILREVVIPSPLTGTRPVAFKGGAAYASAGDGASPYEREGSMGSV